jgi:hypothetical protein
MTNKDHWIKIIQDWEKSGEVAKYWCEKYKVPYVSFITWRKKIKEAISMKEGTSFIEVVDKEENSCTIEIEYQGFILRLEKSFDETLAKKCLKLLKGL